MKKRRRTRKKRASGKRIFKTIPSAIAKLLAVLLTLLALALGIQIGPQTEGKLTVHFLDVGQADAAILQCGGQVMMIDGGNSADGSLIYSYLSETLGIRHIDYMIATHAHEDHIGGLSSALNACTVGTVYSPVTSYNSKQFSSLTKYVQQQGKRLTVPRVGDTLSLGDATVQFLSPAKKYGDTNNTSIVVRVVHGSNTFLFTGDAEWEAEHDMVSSGYDLSAKVLKVGHHGSDTSSSYVFLREVMPQHAVISCGAGNSYGHPSAEILSRLRDIGAAVYRTDLQGTITCVSDGSTLSFSTSTGQTDAWDNLGLMIDEWLSAMKEAVSSMNFLPGKEIGYVGNRGSGKFHQTDCYLVDSMTEANKARFLTRGEAVQKGYAPCGACNP